MNNKIKTLIDDLKNENRNGLEMVLNYYGVDNKGKKYICPFHGDNDPSASIYNGELFKCFSGCGCVANKGLDMVGFIQEKENVGAFEAYNKACEILGVENKNVYSVNSFDRFINWIKDSNKVHYLDNDFKLENIYVYRDIDGKPIILKNKFKNYETGKKKFDQVLVKYDDVNDKYSVDTKGKKPNLFYNTHLLKDVKSSNIIVIVEGEKDADNINKLRSKNIIAISCKETCNVSEEMAKLLTGLNVVVIADNDKKGREHVEELQRMIKDLAKSFRILNIPELKNIGEKADISDYIEVLRNKGLKDLEIIEDLNLKMIRSLDLNDKNELQEDRNGIYKTEWKKDVDGDKYPVKSYLCNFIVEEAKRIKDMDDDDELVELVFVNNLKESKVVIANTNELFNDVRSFNSNLNLAFTFDGTYKDLLVFKAWLNKYKLTSIKEEYVMTGIREIMLNGNKEKVFMTQRGALLSNGVFCSDIKSKSDGVAYDFYGRRELDKDEALELIGSLYGFTNLRNVVNILGSTVACMFNPYYRELRGNMLHITHLVGQHKTGKSYTLGNVIMPLLNIENEFFVYGMSGFVMDKLFNDTMGVICMDEVKPSYSSKNKENSLSSLCRVITTGGKRPKGTKSQKFNDYIYRGCMVMSGEELISEPAVKSRCNIIFHTEEGTNDEQREKGKLFISKRGTEMLNNLGYSLILEVLNNWDSDKLYEELRKVEEMYPPKMNFDKRTMDIYVNTLFGNMILLKVLRKITGSKLEKISVKMIASLIEENLIENTLDGEESVKAMYELILEEIDDMLMLNNNLRIEEGIHYIIDESKDVVYMDLKAIYVNYEEYVNRRGRKVEKFDTFKKMLKMSKYSDKNGNWYRDKVMKTEFGENNKKKVYVLNLNELKKLNMNNLLAKKESPTRGLKK